MRKFFKWVWDVITFGLDIPGRIAVAWVVAGMVATAWAIAWTWLHNLDWVQKGLFSFALFAFFIAFILFFAAWWRKHNLERIADLLCKLDNMTMNYIDTCSYTLKKEQWESMLDEYGQLMKMDLHRFKEAYEKNDINTLNEETDRLIKATGKKLNSTNNNQANLYATITELRDIGELLNKYEIGLKSLKSTPEYKSLLSEVKNLQQRLPAMSISAKVNDFLYQSEGYYDLLFSETTMLEKGYDNKPMPIKVAVKKGQVRPILEGQIANLIASVRESIITYNERNQNKMVKK